MFEEYAQFCINGKVIGWSPSPEECLKRAGLLQTEEDIQYDQARLDIIRGISSSQANGTNVLAIALGGMVLVGLVGFGIFYMRRRGK